MFDFLTNIFLTFTDDHEKYGGYAFKSGKIKWKQVIVLAYSACLCY